MKILIIDDCPLVHLANHAHPADTLIGIANDFQVQENGWIQIAPFGDFPHSGPANPKTGKPLFPKGVIQRVDRGAGEAMINEFNSLLSKVGRAIKGERPWYVGHHDADPIKYPDPKSYGWIKELANRDDGVYARVDWTPDGQELIDKKAFKYFSPYWGSTDTRQDDDEGRRIVSPRRLNSVAFTNQPNLPVVPLSNEEDRPNLTDVTKAHLAELYINDAIEEGVLGENERAEWEGYFREDYKTARLSLANADRSEAARKGWITRRANMAAAGAKMPKASAKAAAAMKKTRPPKKSAPPRPVKEKASKAATAPAAATPKPGAPKPPPLPPLKPAAVRPQQLSTTLPGGHQVAFNPHAIAAAHTMKYGSPNPFF